MLPRLPSQRPHRESRATERSRVATQRRQEGCDAEVPEEGQYCDAHKPAEAPSGGEAPAEQPAAEDKPAEGGGGEQQPPAQ